VSASSFVNCDLRRGRCDGHKGNKGQPRLVAHRLSMGFLIRGRPLTSGPCSSRGRYRLDAEAIGVARDSGDLVVKIGNEFRRRDFIGNMLRHRAAVANSLGIAWDERMDSESAIHLPKWKASAFCNPTLSKVLSENNVTRLVFAGLFAKGCVTSTALAVMKLGHDIEIISDAVACRDDASRQAALTRLKSRGAVLVRSCDR
jgi:nicotinamidase-related amidase